MCASSIFAGRIPIQFTHQTISHKLTLCEVLNKWNKCKHRSVFFAVVANTGKIFVNFKIFSSETTSSRISFSHGLWLGQHQVNPGEQTKTTNTPP